jgi:hypothetical protein
MNIENFTGYFKYIKKYSKQINNDNNYEKSFFNFIKDKNVIIVGPSPWMNGKKLGKEIDKYDIVVRLNHGMDLCSSNPEDFGTKTDVIFINQMMRRHYKNELPKEWLNVPYLIILYQRCMNIFNFHFRQGSKMKCNLCKSYIEKVHLIDIHPKDGIVHYKCLNNCDPIKEKHIKIYMDEFREYFDEMDFVIGLRAVLYLLLFKPKKISVYGFDFYNAIKNNKNYSRNDIYTPNYKILNGSIENHKNDEINHKDHDNKQLNLFKKLYEKVNQSNSIDIAKINIDENLFNILYPNK